MDKIAQTAEPGQSIVMSLIHHVVYVTLFKPQFFHLYNGDNNSSYFI